ncbi:MAG: ATP-binding cassette domain-containing protein [Geminicoccaceae bacterium]
MAAPVIALRDIGLTLGGKRLFDSLDLIVARGERICLVGRNGSGKSTLLRLLAGQIEPDRGERFVQPRTLIAYLPQEPDFTGDATALDHVRRGLPADNQGEADYLAEAMLARFGLDPLKPLDGLSGGEARRISLARAMVAEPDVLLLDEPTNHLDLPAIEALEEDIAGFRGAVVMISHDRTFLTKLTRKLWWLDRASVRTLEDGYAAFEAWRDAVFEEEANELYRLNKRIVSETGWLQTGVTARRKRNMGRLRKLHAMRAARAARVKVTGQAKLAMAEGATSGKIVVEAEAISITLGERLLVDTLSTTILRGDRVGIIGPNGASKTTLVRTLIGDRQPDSGQVRLGTNLQMAWFDQQRAQLDPDKSLWATLCPDGGDQINVHGRFRHVVGYLRDFLFDEAQARAPVKSLSGGERNRLLLAKIMAEPCNLLVLDEPTNDLDMETLDLLEEVLSDFDGTLLLVSHDRDFLDRLVTSVIAAEGSGRWLETAGGYRDYHSYRARQAAQASPSKPAQPKSGEAPGGSAKPTPPRKQGLPTKLQRERDRLPAKIEALQAEIRAIEAHLADPALYQKDHARFVSLSQDLERRQSDLGALEERWLELEMLAEEAGVS